MYVGSLSLDLLLGDVQSLKEKRPWCGRSWPSCGAKFAVSAAETGHLDLHRRAEIGVAVVAPDAGHCRDVLDACERLVAGRPEVDLLSVASACGTTPTERPGCPRREEGAADRRPARPSCTTRPHVRHPEEDDAMADTARARKLADRIHEIVARGAGEAGQGPTARVRHGHRHPGHGRPAACDRLLHGPRGRRGAAATAAALESAKGVLRSEVGPADRLRLTPTLAFVADAVPENAPHIDELLARPRAAGRRGAPRSRPARQYAGEADPYRTRTTEADAERRATGDAGEEDLTSPSTATRRAAVPDGLLSSSTSRRASPRTTSSPGCAASPAPGGWATPAPSTRWRRGCWSSASSGPRGCSATSR